MNETENALDRYILGATQIWWDDVLSMQGKRFKASTIIDHFGK